MQKTSDNACVIKEKIALSRKCLEELSTVENSASLDRICTLTNEMIAFSAIHDKKAIQTDKSSIITDDDDNSMLSDEIETKCKEKYTQEFTAAFGEQLDKFRQENTFSNSDLPLLIDCIETSCNSLTPLEKHSYCFPKN